MALIDLPDADTDARVVWHCVAGCCCSGSVACGPASSRAASTPSPSATCRARSSCRSAWWAPARPSTCCSPAWRSPSSSACSRARTRAAPGAGATLSAAAGAGSTLSAAAGAGPTLSTGHEGNTQLEPKQCCHMPVPLSFPNAEQSLGQRSSNYPSLQGIWRERASGS